MVSTHPELERKIKNTKKLIDERKEHLIPELKRKYPKDYITIEEYNKINKIKPWIESHKPLKKIKTEHIHKLPLPLPFYDRIAVLCVDFSDKPAQIPTTKIYERFFSETFNPFIQDNNTIINGGTLKNFYKENSYSTYIPEGQVAGWYRAPKNYSYYVNNDFGFGIYPNNVQKLVEDTITMAILDPNIDWSYIDANNDNIIDYLLIIHAGAEAAYTGSANDIWSHVWEINPMLIGGKGFHFYAMVHEFLNTKDSEQITGVDCHEFGHLMGIPDLYDYTGNSRGAGMFSLMAYGSWGYNGKYPTHLDVWSKQYLGWLSIYNNPTGFVSIKNIENNNEALKYDNLKPNPNPKEYFLLENRQYISFDYFLPANGILIWHINENKYTNDDETCYLAGVIQADGKHDLEDNFNYGDTGDSYPGSTNNRNFTKFTNPNTRLCDGSLAEISITNISDSSPQMTLQATLCPEILCSFTIT